MDSSIISWLQSLVAPIYNAPSAIGDALGGVVDGIGSVAETAGAAGLAIPGGAVAAQMFGDGQTDGDAGTDSGSGSGAGTPTWDIWLGVAAVIVLLFLLVALVHEVKGV